MDTALEEIRYNFAGGAAQTVAHFSFAAMNGGLQRVQASMTAGILRPTSLAVTHGGARVAGYDFAYEGSAHWFDPWTASTEFWWLRTITRRGAGIPGAPLPAQTFTYLEPASRSCHNGVCVKLLDRADNGYGAVTKIGYGALTETSWRYVTTLETWDGVAKRYAAGDRPQSRVVYSPSVNRVEGVVQLCYDKAYEPNNNPCHSEMGSGVSSEALIGFNTTTVETQAPTAPTGSQWTPLDRTIYTFYNDDYWLLGKTDLVEQFTPSNGQKLSRSDYHWARPDSGKPYVFLQWEAHASFQPDDVNIYVANATLYSYYPVAPGNGNYGGLNTKLELDEAGNAYRCTEYEYVHHTTAWLINRPARETLKAGNCSGDKVSETLYRYGASTQPSAVGLDARGLLSYVLSLASEKTVNPPLYTLEKRAYTPRGLVESVTTYDNTIAYNAGAYPTARRNWTTYSYTPLGQPLTMTTQADTIAAQTQSFDYHATFPWLPDAVTDANAITTNYDYDTFGRLTKVALPGDTLNAPTMTYAYSDGPAPWKVETSYKNTARATERVYYDGLGRVAQTQLDDAAVQDAGNRDLISSVAYDARGLEVCRAAPYAVAATANAFQTAACDTKPHTTTIYDALGRPTAITTPDQATTEMAYDVMYNVNVDGHMSFHRVFVYDGENHLTLRLTDVFGRLALAREYTGNAWVGDENIYAAYADTRYYYTPAGNLKEVYTTQASSPDSMPKLRHTTMAYDVLGRKTGMSDPDMGAWVYAYDAAGNLVRQQAPGNVALCFYYDDFNRPTRRVNDATPGDGCPATPPTPDANHLASYTYGASAADHNVGRVTEVSWGPNPTANSDLFYYDEQGRLTWQYREVGGQLFNYGLADYDVLDRPQTILLPSGEDVSVGYDKEGENSLTAGSTTLIDAVGYNERGQLALLSRANGAPDTTLSYHGATDNFRLNKILHGPEGGALPDFIYGATQYDDAGNLLGMQMKLNGATDSLSYSYDEMNRLKSAALIGAGAANYSYTYAYDRLGNILSRTGTDPDLTYTYGDQTVAPVVEGGPQAVTRVVTSVGADWSYDYDARGNLDDRFTDQTRSHDYTFDAENRLASVRTNNQTTTFAYDADGQRVMTTRPDGTIIYTPFPDYEREVAAGGAVTERTTYRIAGRIVAVRSAGEYSYTYGDHLGNVVGLSNLSGGFNTYSVARYDPFGNFRTTPTTNPGTTSRGFTGHVHNNTGLYPTQNVGLIYMNARYYLPEVGRFVSADSIVPEPEEPQSYNRYSYGFNNPVKYVDPSGHDPLSQEWRDEFEKFHHRQPDWFDEFIRLFSIAYPDEWNWSAFYNPDGSFKGVETLDVILQSAPASRSWDSLPSALARLGTAYTVEEKDLFVRDVGFLYGAMPARSQNPGWRGHRPYYSVGALGGNRHVYLQRGSLSEGFFVRPNGQSDPDFNVHHWAWAFTVGYELGFLGVPINNARELGTALSVREAVDGSDIAIGTFGAYTGMAFHLPNFQPAGFPRWFEVLRVDASP